MEFDFGNILYIVVTIIALVAGIAGKKKKKPVTTGSAPAQEKSPLSFLEQLGIDVSEFEPKVELREEDVVYDEESFEYEEEEEPEPIVESTPAPGIFSSYEGIFNPELEMNKNLIEREAIQSTAPIELIDLDDLEDSGMETLDLVKNFDPVSAVIYSEILQRRAY